MALVRALPSWYTRAEPRITQADIEADRRALVELERRIERDEAYGRYMACLGCHCYRCKREAERLFNAYGGFLT